VVVSEVERVLQLPGQRRVEVQVAQEDYMVVAEVEQTIVLKQVVLVVKEYVG
jgi:hypothetical protein